MENAIAKAIEGGYKLSLSVLVAKDHYEHMQHMSEIAVYPSILLDPLFWQALGKQQGWQSEWKDKAITSMIEPRWRYEWHALIDHIAQGKDINDFFATLLTEYIDKE